jgi:hypothetical protein
MAKGQLKMTFIKTMYSSLSIIFLLSSCSLTSKSEHESMSEIYSDVMAYEFSLGSRGYIDYCSNGDLVVSSLTEEYSGNKDWEGARRAFPKLEKETWENFVQVSTERMPFPTDLDLGCAYTLLDVETNPPGWSRENCIGIEYFSQIGFNSHNNQALVWRSVSCGDFGFGNMYFAELIDGRWIVTEISEGFIT